jgi:uncharacterized membrane protein
MPDKEDRIEFGQYPSVGLDRVIFDYQLQHLYQAFKTKLSVCREQVDDRHLWESSKLVLLVVFRRISITTKRNQHTVTLFGNFSSQKP